ncbi:MAG TPA: hypothetical protein VFZ65_01000 [Planctomycetota bacterium]|nr:hypothetical protein [Planctomycetota bacterium]
MNRRSFLVRLSSAALALASCRTAAVVPQDREFLQALERAQRHRPTVLHSAGRIAPIGETGTPLVIHGRVLRANGLLPAPDVVVFAYHADATGRYDAPSAGPHSWRLRGWVRTDADGRFSFATIRPAPYPSNRVAAHVHLALEGPDVPQQFSGILFAGDPLLTADELRKSNDAGRFGSVRPVETRIGAQHVTIEIRTGA